MFIAIERKLLDVTALFL